MVVNPTAGIDRELAQARARARLRKTIRLRRAHYMRKRPLSLGDSKRFNLVALFAILAIVLVGTVTVGTPLTAGAAAFGIYSHYAQDLPCRDARPSETRPDYQDLRPQRWIVIRNL